MIIAPPSSDIRPLTHTPLTAELIVVGGGLAGTCAAISAARMGIRVILVQDRPVLGGNSSSEVRLWGLGATSHMANNNRWSREGGLVDELLVENLYRNREGNPLMWDALLLEKVRLESNITLLLNTAVHHLRKSSAETIESVEAFCSQNQTLYTLGAPLFCDASGDGIVGFQAGAAFRMGAEKKEEFDEGFAPDASYGELLGHTIYFYSKDTGKPVQYTAPAFALKDITQIPRFKNIRVHDTGCNFWWIEYGGRRDTIAGTEDIKWELWKIVYGIWDHIKNSGQFPEAETLTLEWVGTIPGKRESRRFEGDYMITQRDIVHQTAFSDAVAVGGWSIDLHPADAIYSDKSPCNQYHSKGVYGIPYRCYYSRNIRNLFLAGRVVSTSHVAFGSTRVMLTCAHGGCAVGVAAALCSRDQQLPRSRCEPAHMLELQSFLNRQGQGIPGFSTPQDGNLATLARVEASSTFALDELPAKDQWVHLAARLAQLVPWEPDYRPMITIRVRSAEAGTLRVSLRHSAKDFNFTPEITVESIDMPLEAGEQELSFRFSASVPFPTYAFLTFTGHKGIELQRSGFFCTGLLLVANDYDPKVAKGAEQNPPPEFGIDRFEFWKPGRRDWWHNLAMRFEPPLARFACTDYLFNGVERPRIRSNAWIASPSDPAPALCLSWETPVRISEITLFFDNDFDHAMETVQWGHPEKVVPFVVRSYRIFDGAGKLLHACADNHQTLNRIHLEQPLPLTRLRIECDSPSPDTPAALMGLWITGSTDPSLT